MLFHYYFRFDTHYYYALQDAERAQHDAEAASKAAEEATRDVAEARNAVDMLSGRITSVEDEMSQELTTKLSARCVPLGATFLTVA
jgi:hypothetical protein